MSIWNHPTSEKTSVYSFAIVSHCNMAKLWAIPTVQHITSRFVLSWGLKNNEHQTCSATQMKSASLQLSGPCGKEVGFYWDHHDDDYYYYYHYCYIVIIVITIILVLLLLSIIVIIIIVVILTIILIIVIVNYCYHSYC